jgi:molecular chaperone GrpE
MSEENNSQVSNQNSTGGTAQNAAGTHTETAGNSSEIQKLQEQAEKYKNDFLFAHHSFDAGKSHITSCDRQLGSFL